MPQVFTKPQAQAMFDRYPGLQEIGGFRRDVGDVAGTSGSYRSEAWVNKELGGKTAGRGDAFLYVPGLMTKPEAEARFRDRGVGTAAILGETRVTPGQGREVSELSDDDIRAMSVSHALTAADRSRKTLAQMLRRAGDEFKTAEDPFAVLEREGFQTPKGIDDAVALGLNASDIEALGGRFDKLAAIRNAELRARAKGARELEREAQGAIDAGVSRAREERALDLASRPRGPGAYDTKLETREDVIGFVAWKQAYAAKDSGEDYDLRGAFKAGVVPGRGGHMPDTFKKPNHPTFSVESKYSTPERPGGTWSASGDTFTPSAWMAQDPQRMRDLLDYVGKAEPGVSVILPGQEGLQGPERGRGLELYKAFIDDLAPKQNPDRGRGLELFQDYVSRPPKPLASVIGRGMELFQDYVSRPPKPRASVTGKGMEAFAEYLSGTGPTPAQALKSGAGPDKIFDIEVVPELRTPETGRTTLRADARPEPDTRPVLRSTVGTPWDVISPNVPRTGNAALDTANALIGAATTFGPAPVASAKAAGKVIPEFGSYGSLPGFAPAKFDPNARGEMTEAEAVEVMRPFNDKSGRHSDYAIDVKARELRSLYGGDRHAFLTDAYLWAQRNNRPSFTKGFNEVEAEYVMHLNDVKTAMGRVPKSELLAVARALPMAPAEQRYSAKMLAQALTWLRGANVPARTLTADEAVALYRNVQRAVETKGPLLEQIRAEASAREVGVLFK